MPGPGTLRRGWRPSGLRRAREARSNSHPLSTIDEQKLLPGKVVKQHLEFDGAVWLGAQVVRYGSMASTEELHELLKSWTPVVSGHLPAQDKFEFTTFSLPGRPGRFAFTSEVAAWLVSQRNGIHAKTKRSKVVIAERKHFATENLNLTDPSGSFRGTEKQTARNSPFRAA